MTRVAPSLQDFSLIKTYVEKACKTFDLSSKSFGFSYFVLDLLLNLQEDEIEDTITDSFYLESREEDESGHDRGIDALYIDNETTPNTIHIFNFKYTEVFRKTNSHFPANEIDKIVNFIRALIGEDRGLRDEVNKVLYSKVEEVWSIFNTQNPNFVIHLCCNFYNGLEEAERKRFEKEIEKYSYFAIEYHLMPDFVSLLTQKGKKVINGRVRVIEKNLFEKSGGDIKALIVALDARNLIRILLDDSDIRKDVDFEDDDLLRKHNISEDAFEDNVRIYLKQRSRINRNIKETALSEDSHRFFYFNNGITITCRRFSYPKGRHLPTIDLENIQVVNGGQTVHALYEAYLEDPARFEDIEVLCRIYETHDLDLSSQIAEYTNSQNPVNSRDIRANDFVQKKLEIELLAKGYYYERKKGQHQDQPKAKRIDAEKAGQVLMAFFNNMPSEAKDQKRLMFSDKFDEIFNENITADYVLLAVNLFDRIETVKKQKKAELLVNEENFEEESFILHSSYYLLYVLRELALHNSINIEFSNLDPIWSSYDDAVAILRQAVQLEQVTEKEQYNHRVFFKGNRPKRRIEEIMKGNSNNTS